MIKFYQASTVRLKLIKLVAVCIGSFVCILYSLNNPGLAGTAPGKDVFGGANPGMYTQFRNHLSRLDIHGPQKQNWQQGPYIRDKWAVLVGVNRYQDTSIKSLRIARNDVALMATILKEPSVGRFQPDHVMALVGRGAMRDAIQEAILDAALVKKALPNDLILLYFSGRTLPVRDDICLCAYDTLVSEADMSGVKLGEMLSNLRKRTQCAQIVCVLDCAAVSQKDYAKPNAMSLDELSKKCGVSIISASALNEETPACNAGTISSFALHFADALRNSAGALSLQAITNNVQENLNKTSQELGTVSQIVSFLPAIGNARVGDLVIGAAVKKCHRPVAIGHNVGTLALDRPDLLASNCGRSFGRTKTLASSTVGSTPKINEAPVLADDEQDGKFSKVDFGPWMDKMKSDIRAKWKPPKGLEYRHAACTFTVLRDGSIVEPTVVESSGQESIDESALTALKVASPLDPLPQGAPESVQIRYLFDWRVQHH